MPEKHEAQSAADKIEPETIQMILTTIAEAIDAEPPGKIMLIRNETGQTLGKQIVIDATDKEKGGLYNLARLSMINADMDENGEAARIEYEHDKEGKYGPERVYSISSVRLRAGRLTLMEDFLAESPETVREADFREISSEAYAQGGVLENLREWTKYRLWQRKQGK